ncbi:MFS transporter, partial [Mycobacterium tuberculosis]|nr:MFS transporter [Mycobacterium tuberculosis]
ILLLPLVFLLRRPPPEPAIPAASADGSRPMTSARTALGSPQFAVLAITFFFCCAAHSGPIFHMVSYATVCGIAPMAAVSIYGVEGAAGLVGRLLLGVLADRFGVKEVIIGGLAVQALAISG